MSRRGHKTGQTLTCPQCTKQFYVPGSVIRLGRRFCSHKCWAKDHYISKRCRFCREFFRQRKGDRERKFCSLPCRTKAKRGPLSPLFRGATASSFRGTDWPEKRDEARRRDEDVCQVCGADHSTGERPTVDHIVPFRIGGSNEAVNLLTVCRAPCHAAKTAAEIKLINGDRLGFDQRLRHLGWPMEKVNAAVEHWNRTPQMPILFRKVAYKRRRSRL